MAPAFKEGDRLFASPIPYWFFSPRAGDAVILLHPFQKKCILKRIKTVLPEERYLVAGDNEEESTDSRSFGSVSKRHIIGKVLFRYA